MSTWAKQKLAEICNIKSGKTNSQDALLDGKYLLFDRSREIKRSNKYLFDLDAVILPGEGQDFLPRFYSGKFDLHQRAYAIWSKNKKATDIRFIYFSLVKHREYFAATATGATVKSLRLPQIGALEVPCPDLPTQTGIASVLSAYDDLIENNEKRIRALEEMAQLLYTEWFVKFKFSAHEQIKRVDSGTDYGMIPEGWEVKNVEGLIKRIPVGKRYENKSVSETGKVPVLGQGKSGFIGFHNDEPGVKASLENPVIVFANHTCYQNIIVYPFSAIQNILPFRPNDDRDIVWLHWATKDLIKFNDYKGHWPEFMAKKLIVPSVDATKRFGALVGKYVAMRYELEMENKNLSKTRDLLIPQLVTGRWELQ